MPIDPETQLDPETQQHGRKPRRIRCIWTKIRENAPVIGAFGANLAAVFTILIWYHQVCG